MKKRLAPTLVCLAAIVFAFGCASQSDNHSGSCSDFRGEARHVCKAFDSATNDLYEQEFDCAHAHPAPDVTGNDGPSTSVWVCPVNPNWNPTRGVVKLRLLGVRARLDALVGLLPWRDVYGSDQWPGFVQDVRFSIDEWNERVNDCRKRRADPNQDAADFANRRCEAVLNAASR